MNRLFGDEAIYTVIDGGIIFAASSPQEATYAA